MNYDGEKFLLKLYQDLDKKEEVLLADKRSGKNSGNKYELLNKYLKRLERQEKIFDGEHEELEKYLKNRYYDKYCIKEEDIPESYWKHNEQIALERGYGHIKYDDAMKHREAEKIIEEQQNSLDKWINYLMKENASYPMWTRYWAFQGVLKLGKYDKEKHAYSKRTKGTITPFIELDAEVLAKTIDNVIKYQQDKEVNDEKLESLIKSGNFGKIYAYNFWKTNEEIKKELNHKAKGTDGIWKKYYKKDYKEVVKSLEGKGTGWCIAAEHTAKDYLNRGTLEIYFTKDKEGNYTMPRACIRTEYDEIAEVRGIEKDQNMEPEILSIVDKKLDEYPDKEKYKKKVSDMKKLTELYEKNKKNEKFTEKELYFLFEINHRIEGFGWWKDPRIKEIRENIIISDKKFMLEAVKKNGLYLKSASEALKNDKRVVLEAVKQNGLSLEFASEALKDDKKLVLKAVKQNGLSLEFASEKLRDDKRVVLKAVKRKEYALKYASEKLKSNKKAIVEAVIQGNPDLKHVKKRLNVREIVLESIKNGSWDLSHLNNELKNDKEIVLTAAKSYNNYFREFGPRYTQVNSFNESIGEELKKDKEFMLEAVKRFGWPVLYASEELKKDKEFMLEAVKQNFISIDFLTKELKNDKEFMLKVAKIARSKTIVSGEELKKDKEYILEIVGINGYNLIFASEELKKDKEVVLTALKENGKVLEYVSEELKNDKEVVLTAAKNIREKLEKDGYFNNSYKEYFKEEYVGKKLKNDKEFIKQIDNLLSANKIIDDEITENNEHTR